MSDKLTTRVIQVTNIAPSCSKEQLRTLFGYLGRIKELHMYPPENAEGVVTARVAYLEFEDAVTTGVALHLSSTVFIDRAIMIVPVMDGKIPDESTALQLTPSAVAGMLPGQPTWPANVVSQVTGLGANQKIMTNDPRLTSLGLPQYPSLPATTDPSKIEEIRRTVYVSDLDQKVTPEMLLTFFSQTGEIKYIRMAGEESGSTRSAYIEFTDQRCIAQALSYNNVVFQGRTVSVKHATTSIVKPSAKSEASQREIDEAMKKVKEASKLISAAANTDREKSSTPPKRRSRTRSRGRSRSHSRPRRSRSRSRGRRRRTRSRSRKRSRSRRRSPKRSRTPPRRRRSRSRGRVAPSAPPVRRSRSRDKRRSRTRSPVRRKRSRSISTSRTRRKSRTPPKSYSRVSPPARNRRSRSRSRKRSRSRDRDRKEKARERKKTPSASPPRLERDGSLSRRDEKDSSPRDASRRKRKRRSKSPTPRKRSRSRSGSRHKSKKERKRSRSRDRKHDSKKKSVREKEERKKESSSSSTKVKRDYDEEEKGFVSEASDDHEQSEERESDSPPDLPPAVMDKDIDHQTVDMDMSD